MNLMIMLITINSHLLLSLKDSIIVAFYGVETLSFVRSYVMLPVSLFFFVIYTMLVNRFNQKSIFHGTIWGFLLFLLTFAYYSYPYNALNKMFLMLFYSVSEIWIMMMCGTLFWQFANTIYKDEDVKNTYWCFQIMASIGTIISGQMIFRISACGVWVDIVNSMLLCFFVCSMIISLLCSMVYKRVSFSRDKFDRLKLPYLKSVKLLFAFPIIRGLLILVISYGCIGTLTEMIWKFYAKLLYPTVEAYNGLLGEYTTWMGMSAVALNLFNGVIFKQFSFGSNNKILLFFVVLFVLLEFVLILIYNNFDTTKNLLKVIVYVGLFQQVSLKGGKYALFDPSKERLYISMSREYKTKGKALVDSFGNRFGKTLGSLLQYSIFSMAGLGHTMVNCTFFIIVMILLVWFQVGRKIPDRNVDCD